MDNRERAKEVCGGYLSLVADVEAALNAAEKRGNERNAAELARLQAIERAARDLAAKLKLIHSDLGYVRVWQEAAHHLGTYTGPQYDRELETLKAALSDQGKEK